MMKRWPILPTSQSEDQGFGNLRAGRQKDAVLRNAGSVPQSWELRFKSSIADHSFFASFLDDNVMKTLFDWHNTSIFDQ